METKLCCCGSSKDVMVLGEDGSRIVDCVLTEAKLASGELAPIQMIFMMEDAIPYTLKLFNSNGAQTDNIYEIHREILQVLNIDGSTPFRAVIGVQPREQSSVRVPGIRRFLAWSGGDEFFGDVLHYYGSQPTEASEEELARAWISSNKSLVAEYLQREMEKVTSPGSLFQITEEVDLRVLLCQDEPSLTVTPFMETLKELFADNREWEEMLNIPDKAVSIPWRFLDSRLLPLYAVTFWAKKLQYVQNKNLAEEVLPAQEALQEALARQQRIFDIAETLSGSPGMVASLRQLLSPSHAPAGVVVPDAEQSGGSPLLLAAVPGLIVRPEEVPTMGSLEETDQHQGPRSTLHPSPPGGPPLPPPPPPPPPPGDSSCAAPRRTLRHGGSQDQ